MRYLTVMGGAAAAVLVLPFLVSLGGAWVGIAAVLGMMIVVGATGSLLGLAVERVSRWVARWF